MQLNSLGIDIGGSSVKLAMRRGDQTLWTAASSEYARPNIEQLIEAMRSVARGRELSADVAGICVPGLLDRSTRTITLAVNVPGLMNVPLDELISRAFGVGTVGRIEIINDAIAAATDYSATKNLHGRLLAIALGTGVGAAVLDDGRPLRVEGDSPGHIGQLDVSVPGHEVIGPDGGAGSLEAYIGGAALRARGLSAQQLTIDDPAIHALVKAIRICHAMFRPGHVVLLGGVGIRLSSLLCKISAAVNENLTSVARRGWTLRVGDTEFHAAVGAARIADDFT